jgi:16S rRNA A1518/A1519 N6-dimethyltransferase RsmA/KsgA/DIM1 with predicted DNA glycosylase/AP lyase activity
VPKVDSALLKLSLKEKTYSISTKFFDFLRYAFKESNKMLINILHSYWRVDKAKLREILEKKGIDPQIRPKKLFLEEWYKLYEGLRDFSPSFFQINKVI